jgi:hypothetical protein
MDPLEKIIRPIVEGQIRGFLLEHPAVVEAVDWYKPRQDKSVTFVNSLSKRIVRDLTCPMVRARLSAALLELVAEAPQKSSMESVALWRRAARLAFDLIWLRPRLQGK